MSAYKSPDGTWRYRRLIYVPRLVGSVGWPDGKKRISGTPALNTKKAAQDAEAAAIELELNPKAETIPTFKVFADTFLTEKGREYKPSQLAEINSILKNHLVPAWGDKRIDSIRSTDVSALTATIGLSRVRHVLTVASKILKYARKAQYIAALPELERPKVVAEIINPYLPEEYLALQAASAAEPFWHALILVGGDCGLRAGELFGLKWSDINFEENTLSVNRAVWHGIVGTPKSKSSKRSIPMSLKVSEALSSLPSRSGLVFKRPEGEYLTHGALRHAIKRLERAAKLPVVGRAHRLRHTFGSNLANLGHLSQRLKS